MNLNRLKKASSREESEAAIIEIVNDFHDQEGTPDDERPDKAELEKALRPPRNGEEAAPLK